MKLCQVGSTNTIWHINVNYVETFCTHLKCEVKHNGMGHLWLKWVGHLLLKWVLEDMLKPLVFNELVLV